MALSFARSDLSFYTGEKVRFRCVKCPRIDIASPGPRARHAPASSHWLHAIVLKLNDDPLALSRAHALPTPAFLLPLAPLALSAVTCTRAANHMPRIVGDVARTSSLSKVLTGGIARARGSSAKIPRSRWEGVFEFFKDYPRYK